MAVNWYASRGQFGRLLTTIKVYEVYPGTNKPVGGGTGIIVALPPGTRIRRPDLEQGCHKSHTQFLYGFSAEVDEGDGVRRWRQYLCEGYPHQIWPCAPSRQVVQWDEVLRYDL
jgi:hypothetical protein